MCVYERERGGVRERVCLCVRERGCVCCVREREYVYVLCVREDVCVLCEREREREMCMTCV